MTDEGRHKETQRCSEEQPEGCDPNNEAIADCLVRRPRPAAAAMIHKNEECNNDGQYAEDCCPENRGA